MSLPDHYQILEIAVTATSAEIKAAYRRLAKIFHPDKNAGSPAAEEKFKQVKEAYETLINPLRRRKYDEKRNRSLTTPASSLHKKQNAKKNYNFSEEEAKRRKYYQQHYGKTTTRKESVPEKEKPFPKELKYILVSVPLAVALLLLIIRLYERPKHIVKSNVAEEETTTRVRTPDSPYEAQVGRNFYDTSGHSVVTVQNRCGNDALVFLKNDTGKIVRHHFIENNYEVMMENLPTGNYRLYYWIGKNFSNRYYLFGDIIGNFERAFCTDSMKDKITLKATEIDTFLFEIHNNFSCRSDSIFLKKIFNKIKA
jgi:curved DNA-binding protein CbpA